MRFLVDECTGPAVASWLRDQSNDVFSVFDEARGMDDEDIIRKVRAEQRFLITNDKDFGDKVYRVLRQIEYRLRQKGDHRRRYTIRNVLKIHERLTIGYKVKEDDGIILLSCQLQFSILSHYEFQEF